LDKIFKEEHSPIEDTILILCKPCHREYDENTKKVQAKININEYLSTQSMTEQQMDKALKSVGMKTFVEYFKIFSNPQISREDIIDYLKSENNYTESSCITKTTQARRIINNKMAPNALRKVIRSDSTRVSVSIQVKAKKFLRSETAE
jgi:hypothetical protein